MGRRDVIAIGGSAGGFEALTRLLPPLGADLPAIVLVVVHTSPDAPGFLPALLERAGPLAAAFARNREPLVPGRIYVAPPDFHLVVEGGRGRLLHGPRENGFRPAVDPLFRSVAAAFGPRAAGVVLSGGLDDGTHGLVVIKRQGGVTIVQQPDESLVSGMPDHAIRHDHVDHVLPAGEIGALLARLARGDGGPEGETATGEGIMGRKQPVRAPRGAGTPEIEGALEPPAALTCPECGGALRDDGDGDASRVRCHVGHAFGPAALAKAQDRQVEEALWVAVRSLRERAALRRGFAREAGERGLDALARGYDEQAETAERHALAVRNLLTDDNAAWETREPAGERVAAAAGAENAQRNRRRR